jgi:hypothetical protein
LPHVQSSDSRPAVPKYLSSDHDPLYRFHQWQANLRVLGVTEIKTVPFVPLSHPFVERLIGTIRRECLDHLSFWTAADLEMKFRISKITTTSFAFTGRWKIKRQFRLRNPNGSASNVTRGRNTVAVYTKRQEPPEDAFAIDRFSGDPGSAETQYNSRLELEREIRESEQTYRRHRKQNPARDLADQSSNECGEFLRGDLLVGMPGEFFDRDPIDVA